MTNNCPLNQPKHNTFLESKGVYNCKVGEKDYISTQIEIPFKQGFQSLKDIFF